jgi:hypothetical protein
MTDCTRLSERMPAVALGRERWTEDEERHLALCEDCRAEWVVVSVGSRLGLALSPAEPGHTAAAALARLERERRRARVRARAAALGGLAAAAAVTLVLWGGKSVPMTRDSVPGRPVGPVAGAPTPPLGSAWERHASAATAAVLDLPLPELDSLPAEALDSMLKSLDEPLAQVAPDDGPVDDSGDQELARVLDSLEG